jgi:hypothetical protein
MSKGVFFGLISTIILSAWFFLTGLVFLGCKLSLKSIIINVLLGFSLHFLFICLILFFILIVSLYKSFRG